MRVFILLLFFLVLIFQNETLFAQEERSSVAFFGGFSSNTPVFGIRNDAYNLRFDSQYFWLSTSIGVEKFLKRTKASTFITQLNYQGLPNASMAITQSESIINGVYTRQFDSLIMKSDNIRFSVGVKHYFSEAYTGFYIQYNAGLNLIFNQTSSCSCTRIESEGDNFFSETGTYFTEKRKVLMAELSLTFGYVVRLNDRFAIDTGFDLGMPFGRMKYQYIKDEFPLPSVSTKVMNLNALFLTSLIEAHAKIIFIK